MSTGFCDKGDTEVALDWLRARLSWGSSWIEFRSRQFMLGPQQQIRAENCVNVLPRGVIAGLATREKRNRQSARQSTRAWTSSSTGDMTLAVPSTSINATTTTFT